MPKKKKLEFQSALGINGNQGMHLVRNLYELVITKGIKGRSDGELNLVADKSLLWCSFSRLHMWILTAKPGTDLFHPLIIAYSLFLR